MKRITEVTENFNPLKTVILAVTLITVVSIVAVYLLALRANTPTH